MAGFYSAVDRRKAAIAAILADPEIETVVVSGNIHAQAVLEGAGWAEDDGSGFSRLWARFVQAGKRVVVIDDVPPLRTKLPECLARPHAHDDPCARPASEVPEENPFTRAVALLPPGMVTFVPVRDAFCDADRCHAIIGGIPAYMDADHISAPMARSLSQRIKAAIVRAPAAPARERQPEAG